MFASDLHRNIEAVWRIASVHTPTPPSTATTSFAASAPPPAKLHQDSHSPANLNPTGRRRNLAAGEPNERRIGSADHSDCFWSPGPAVAVAVLAAEDLNAFGHERIGRGVFDRREQGLPRHGFAHITVHSGGNALVQIALHGSGCQRDDRKVRAGQLLP